MIRTLRCKETEGIFRRQHSRKFANIALIARRKLRMLDAADRLEDLAAIPGNRLEAMKGSRRGQYSTRINDQWRVCFVWRARAAEDVEIIDYH